MSDQMSGYLKARAEFEGIKRELDAFANVLTGTAQALRRQPERMIFSNVSAGLPVEASMSRDSISIDANHWKSPLESCSS